MVRCGACWARPFSALQTWSADSAQAHCGGQIYLVGGAIRDQLLGRPVTERDWVVVGSTPEQMRHAGFRLTDPDFPVFLHPLTGEEHALARYETNTASGYRGFALDISPQITIEQDLARRDLTINAMAQDAAGQLIDPYQGQQDLADRCLRQVTPAFAEDPVRVLRTARFAAELGHLGFIVAPETQQLMRHTIASDHELIPARLWCEMQKALACTQPWHYFAWLARAGVRPIADIPATIQAQALSALRHLCARTSDPDIRFGAYALHCPQIDELHSVQPRRTTRLLGQARRAWSQLPTLSGNAPVTVWTFLQRLRAWHTGGNYAAVMQILQAQQQYESLLARIQFAQVAAAQVRSDTLRAQGLYGTELGQALRDRRQTAIAAVLAGRAGEEYVT